MQDYLKEIILDIDSISIQNKIVHTVKNIPNTFKKTQREYYQRETRSIVIKIVIWVNSQLRKLYDPLFNPSGFSPSVLVKYHFYEKFLGISPASDGYILDIGCGTGGFLRYFAKKHPKVICVGIDTDLEKLELVAQTTSNENIDNIILIHGRMQKQIFKDSVFKGIISTQVFEHFSSDLISLVWKEVRRVSKFGARIIIEVPGQRFNTSNFTFFRILSSFKTIRRKYPILEDFHKVGTYPALEKHQHYVLGYDERAFHNYLSDDLCFRNFAYTLGPLTGWAFILRCFAKYFDAITYFPEHILSIIEAKLFSRKPGYNIILVYEKIEPPAHVFGIE